MDEKIFDINESKALIFEDDEGRFTLSPRGCFASALADTDIAETGYITNLAKNAKFNSAFDVLVRRFEKAGLLQYDGKPEKTHESNPKDIFKKVVLGFYKNATEEQIESAFDLFYILLERHGNTVKIKTKS